MIIPLNKLKINQKGIIKNIEPGPLEDRFYDLGFTKEAIVECVLKSPFNDPTAYKIKGTLIAIREEDAATIKVGVMDEQ